MHSISTIPTLTDSLIQGGEAEPSEGCSYLTRVAPVVIKMIYLWNEIEIGEKGHVTPPNGQLAVFFAS